ncbi:MAG: hypothetical protein N4A46_04140 [Schleiferiaceae bacterium]|nr:hypothetical protein [Schleiferiaceae bacterium]
MKKLIIVLLASSLLWACKQGDPSFNQRTDDVLTFSGMKWRIKSGFDGPGPNNFTNHPNDVFIDDNGHLHLSVTERNGVWNCTEVILADTFTTGYGTYIWTTQGDPVNIDRNIVLGLFTWDYNTFQEAANSEVDIEFAKWGDPEEEYTLQYGVQPIAFGPYNEERVHKPEANNNNWIGTSTHAFTWTDSLITWESWSGPDYGVGDPAASWSFDLNNPPKRKFENGNISDPIIIPAPGNTTGPHMNLWLVNGPEGPFVPIRHEIIIQKFQYIPLQ